MPVDAWGLFLSTVQVVLLPVGCGLLLHHAAPRLVQRVTPMAPLVSVITIALICANILGVNAAAVRAHLLELGVAVALLHAGGFALGYLAARVFGYEEVVRRTVSIEVGMQNSGLGAALATKHFAHPTTGVALAAVPCAISAVMHSVIGSILAAVWRSRPPRSVTQQASGRQPPTPPLPERGISREPAA
jgi:BASS family bile acid:Na+ symporter